MSPQERANNIPAGGKLRGRWHDMSGRTRVAIVESDDLAAVHRWIGQWNPYMDIDLTPVVDDEESAAIGRQIVATTTAERARRDQSRPFPSRTRRPRQSDELEFIRGHRQIGCLAPFRSLLGTTSQHPGSCPIVRTARLPCEVGGNLVRTRLAAGGRGIRTLGPSRDGVTDSRGGEGAAG